MGIIDSFLTNHDSIGKGFTRIFKGASVYMLRDSENKLKAFIVGDDTSKQLIEKYNKDLGYTFSYIYMRKLKPFIKDNEDKMLCIIEKELLTFAEVKEKYGLENITPDKVNKFLTGFRKYNLK